MQVVIQSFLKIFVERLAESVPREKIIDAADFALDQIENKVADTKNKLDDIFVLPFIKLIRATFGIPDGDD